MSNAHLNKSENSIVFLSESRDTTFHLGEAFGSAAMDEGMIALIGPLGAGKTLFVQGLAEGLEVKDSSVCSPTYLLVHLHEGRIPLCHVDLYRLNASAEVGSFGLEEMFDSQGVCAVEWADKGLAFLPSERLTIQFNMGDGDRREMLLTATGSFHQAWLERVSRLSPLFDLKESAGVKE